jgi:hypothetical protein
MVVQYSSISYVSADCKFTSIEAGGSTKVDKILPHYTASRLRVLHSRGKNNLKFYSDYGQLSVTLKNHNWCLVLPLRTTIGV